MQIEAVNVVEMLDNRVVQIITFTGDAAAQEADLLFERLILEHNDPDNDPPQNVLGFEPETFENWKREGEYDDDNGYVVSIVYSSLPPKSSTEDPFTNWKGDSDGSVGVD